MDSLDVISWNLFHGRDAAPDEALQTWRSRLWRTTERNATHAQVNRSLLHEFEQVLAALEWDVALLQEAPPRWLRPLCRACSAHGAATLTARNLGARARSAIARRNPDLIASGEGGSNQVLVRPPWRIADVRRLTLTRRPERRRLLFARLERPAGGPVFVANLHATAHDERAAARDVELAARHALDWAGDAPLAFGGDLNLRPASAPAAFERLAGEYGLGLPEDPQAVDHLLVRGLVPTARPRPLPDAERECVRPDGLRIRLSDHAPLVATFSLR